MKINLPENVKKIISTLNSNGHEAYAVGGCIRDRLMNREPKDWDITTSALPHKVKALFSRTFDTGIKHGTITVVFGRTSYEVTTYRIDGDYKDFRHPEDVTFTKKIEEDLSRRDFTMNAIAYNDESGFCDPFGGKNDIKNKTIRGVGDPNLRFNEDALRMMRGVRFSAQLNFKIETETYNAIIKNHTLIKNISIERIRDEFFKLLLSPNPEKLTALKTTKLLGEFLPMLSSALDTDSNIIYSIKKLKDRNEHEISVFLAAIFSFLTEKELHDTMKYLKCDTKTLKETALLVKNLKQEINPSPYEIRKYISSIGSDSFLRLLRLKTAFSHNHEDISEIKCIHNEIISRGDCCSLKDLALNGNDLSEYGIKNGKKIGAALSYLLKAVLKDPSLNEKEKLLKLLDNIC